MGVRGVSVVSKKLLDPEAPVAALLRKLEHGEAYVFDGEVRFGSCGRIPQHPSRPVIIDRDGRVTEYGWRLLEEEPLSQRMYYTFAAQKGTETPWVMVDAPLSVDHRALLLAWLADGEEFAAEYSEPLFWRYASRYAVEPLPVAVVTADHFAGLED